jgi:L-fuconolactonase
VIDAERDSRAGAQPGAEAPSPVIDAHQHFWRVARGDYGWLTPALAPLWRDFMPADLAPTLARHAIQRTILVQAAPTVAETDFLLAIADATPWVAGVVGWLDFAARDAVDAIARLATHPRLVGVRPMVQDIADDDWLLDPAFAPVFRALADHRLVFDALVLPRHLPRVARIVERHPHLAVVIDHAGKPPIRDGIRGLDPWRHDLAVLAGAPNVTCKLSGLVTEAASAWTPDHLSPYVGRVLEAFAPRAIVWGSDWPVVEIGGGYDRWREATLALLAGVAAQDRAAILGGNAARVYLARNAVIRP